VMWLEFRRVLFRSSVATRWRSNVRACFYSTAKPKPFGGSSRSPPTITYRS